MIGKIISGGQSGVDRAGLDAALDLGIPIGGYVPTDRWAEDGPIASRYAGLVDSGSPVPAVRTRLNVQHSDATLVVTRGRAKGGSALTIKIALDLDRPHLHIDLLRITPQAAAAKIKLWLSTTRFETLNIAGSRESLNPGIYDEVRAILTEALG
ncbi:MAG TPA: putative molybdenum carrier protein [Pyrinomonadaceae bacterium]|nr:putative molybdenum carrier protein [Pyrinomonadaceae bacterium]